MLYILYVEYCNFHSTTFIHLFHWGIMTVIQVNKQLELNDRCLLKGSMFLCVSLSVWAWDCVLTPVWSFIHLIIDRTAWRHDRKQVEREGEWHAAKGPRLMTYVITLFTCTPVHVSDVRPKACINAAIRSNLHIWHMSLARVQKNLKAE